MSKKDTKGTPKKRRDWKPVFLAALSEDAALVAHAAAIAGVSRRGVYHARESDPEFAEAWDAIEQAVNDRAVAALTRRAIEEKDTTALIFFLKKRLPRVYGDNPFEGEVPQSITVSFNGRPKDAV